MHATSKHGTLSLISLLKNGGVSCFGHFSGRPPIQLLTTQPCLTSYKPIEQNGESIFVLVPISQSMINTCLILFIYH